MICIKLYDNIFVRKMTKKTRLFMLIFCVVCFFVLAPILIAYSMGYRFDFEKMKIVATGGIYVRTFPVAEEITIDSKISKKPGMFSNSVFVQSLLPKNHTVSIRKPGYYDYSKTLPVAESEVTKLENVLLIKKSLLFSSLAEKIDYFSISPDNQSVITAYGNSPMLFNNFSLNGAGQPTTFSLNMAGNVADIIWSDNSKQALIKIQSSGNVVYYLFNEAKPLLFLDKNSEQISFNPQDSKQIFYIKNNILYSSKNRDASVVINNVISYQISNNSIIWLSLAGALNKSDISGKLIEKFSTQNIAPDSKKNYSLFNFSGKIFLRDGISLFLYNDNKKTLEPFSAPAGNFEMLYSPDKKNFVYWDSRDIYIYSSEDGEYKKLFSGEKVQNCQWLNNDYIIFSNQNNIIISETDWRGNINAVTLPQTVNDNGQIFFNRQDNKIYLLANGEMLSSEKIIP